MADHQEGLQGAIEELRRQLEGMTARLAELERAAAPPAKPAPREDAAGGASEEILLVISAAVGAFLGERVRVRQVRLISSPVWGLQGRASIQASHRLDR